VELGLVYRCEVKPLADGQRAVEVDMTLTAPGCGMGEIIVQDAQEKIAVIPTVDDVRVELVFDPPWNQSMMSEEARLQTGLM
jgi:metal-sulfur cluster biosynthetic enzyme